MTTSAPRHRIPLQPLGAAAFAPYGEVVEAASGRPQRPINGGTAQRFDDLARIDTAIADGRPVLSIYRASAQALPLRLREVERHALGSQLFMPLTPLRWLVIVAAAGPAPRAAALRGFVAGPGQGVSLARGTWHHGLLALDAGDFLVVERGAADIDCDVHALDDAEVWVEA